MLDNIKEVFNMPIEENNMDKITETSQEQLKDIAKGVKGKRVEELKNAQNAFDNFMDNFPTNPNGLSPETIDKATKKAIELENNLANATKRVEHVNKVIDESKLNSIVEEVINEVSNEWIRNRLKNVSKSEMDKRIQDREGKAQFLNKSAEKPVGLDKTGYGENTKQKAELETKKAERLKDIKKVAKPSIMDKAKETISNFKKSGAEATKSVIDRAKEAIKNVGDSKVKDAGKSIKTEGKGVIDAVKQGVKDTVKGTINGGDSHSASKSAIERAQEIVKNQEERKAQKDADMVERAKNKIKQDEAKEQRKAEAESSIEKAKKEIEAQKKANEEANKRAKEAAEKYKKELEAKKKAEEQKQEGTPAPASEVTPNKPEADNSKKDEDKKDGEDETKINKDDDKTKVTVDDEDTEAKVDDETKTTDDKNDEGNGSKKVTKSSTVSNGSKTNNVNAINNANISGKQDGNVTINQTANASRQGETKTEGSKEDEAKAGEKEPVKTNKTRLIKKNKKEETPAEETTEIKADDKKEEVTAEAGDNKTEEVKGEGKSAEVKGNTENNKEGSTKVEAGDKKSEDLTDKSHDEALARYQKLSDKDKKKYSLTQNQDGTWSIVDKKGKPLAEESKTKLIKKNKSGEQKPAEDTKPAESEVKEGDNKTQEVKSEDTKNTEVKDNSGETSAEEVKGNSTEPKKDLTKEEKEARAKKAYDKKIERELEAKAAADAQRDIAKFEEEQKNIKDNEEATKLLADMEKAGIDVAKYKKENSDASPAELKKIVLQGSDNEIKALNNKIENISGGFSDELKNIVFNHPEQIKKKIEELQSNNDMREIIKGLANTELLELVNALIEKGKLNSKLKKFKK